MKALTPFLILAFFTVLISCQKDPHESPDPVQSLLKRKLYFNSIDDKEPYAVLNYEYDSNAKLVRTLSGKSFIDSFTYNSINKLAYKRSFENRYTDGFNLVDSTCYQYKDNLLVSEISYFPEYSYPIRYFRYEYENSKLRKKYEFNYSSFVLLTNYDYSGNLCYKETCFADSTGLKLTTNQLHQYKYGKLIKSELFGFNGTKIQEIKYLYDATGNLITEEGLKPNVETAQPYFYVIRYEYYNVIF